MAFLTIAGKDYPVAINAATEDAPTFIGAIGRAVSGGLRRTVRAVKRQWTFTLGPLWEYQYGQLRTDVATAANVTVTGESMGNVNVTAAVILGAAPYIADDPSFRRLVSVTVMES